MDGGTCEFAHDRHSVPDRQGRDMNEESGQSAHILVADGDPAMRHMVVNYLEDHNMRTISVSSRQEIARLLATGEPSLVILDRWFGQENGLDLLHEIRSRSDVPVIITAGDRCNETDRVVGLELGADDYVTKPFGLRELLARIRAVLRRRTGSRTRSASTGSGEGPLPVRWLATRPACPAADRPRRSPCCADQGRICPAYRLPQRATAAAEPGAPAAGDPCPRGRIRSQHRRASPASATQAGTRPERASRHPDRTRRRICVRRSSRADLTSISRPSRKYRLISKCQSHCFERWLSVSGRPRLQTRPASRHRSS
jgi:CheY-like chemotaxis protein